MNPKIPSTPRRTGTSWLLVAPLVGAAMVVAGCTGQPPAAGAAATQQVSARADQQIVLVTGSTDGLGREVASRVAASGAHVIIHGRNQQRGAEVVAEIERAGAGSARFYPADFGTDEGVRQFANAILRDYDRLDVLVNNAGIWVSGDERPVSPAGREMHFQVNYLSGFLLTRMLLPLLREGAPSRIINVASSAQTPIEFDNVMLERGYTSSRGYGQSKLAQILFTMDLHEELQGTGITAVALHPATLMETTLVTGAGATPRSTVAEGADAVMQLVTMPNLQGGQYFNQMNPQRANAQAYDAAAREQLRRISFELTGAPR
jgi:NAD(P)-dependent dehydrogenase (short-subunit alcohol dehydrogenase family)